MGADPHDLPSGFSVVSDSIRRDREALFGATRLDVPTIADGDDSSDGSDVEAPVFFTTTGSDAEAEAEGFGGPLPPGLLSPKPPDVKSGNARTKTGRLREDVRGRTDRDRDAERRTPSSSAAADEAAALAAFELAAERALQEEEARSNTLVRAHLQNSALFGRLDGTDDDEAREIDAPVDDDVSASSSSDDDVSVRARRRPPLTRPKKRHPSVRNDPRETLVDPLNDESQTLSATAKMKDDVAESLAFRGWLSGAAGRLARSSDDDARGDRDSNRDSKTGSFEQHDGMRDSEGCDDESYERVARVASETSLETAFLAQTADDADETRTSAQHLRDDPPPRASLDLGSALGGLDLDGLLSRLEAPGGEAVVARLRERRKSEGVVDLDASSGDEKDGTTVDAATSNLGDEVLAANRRRDVEGWVLSNAKNARDVSRRPQTARDEREGAGKKGEEGEKGAPRGTLDPYGRGTRRARSLVARPQSASPSTKSPPLISRTDLPANSAPEGDDLFDDAFSFTPPKARGTVRINAWDTMDAASPASPPRNAGIEEDGEKLFASEKKESVKSSPSALLAESASRRAADASRAAREAAARASLEADARELAARVRAASDERTRAAVEAAAERAISADREEQKKKKKREKTFTPAFPASVSDSALATADHLRAEGNACFRKGDLIESVKKFTEALTHHPNDVAALANRAAAMLKLNRFAEAEKDASVCLAIDATHSKALHRRAKARTELGDHAGALCDLQALTELLPNHAETRDLLTKARRAAEMNDEKGDGSLRAVKRMEERESFRRRTEEEEAAKWEARRVAGIQAHMERAKAAVRVSRK